MHLARIWRYPVKSMAGEPLREARIGRDGIEGDRVVHVQDAAGRVITARVRPRLLWLRATLGPEGEPRVDGRPWSSPEVARDVAAAAGNGARLARLDGPERFDVLPLLIATDGAVSAFGHDVRRLRPNLVIAGVEGLSERDWEGRILRVGEALIGLHSLRQRCVMTTFDPDTLRQDPEVLRRIQRDFGGRLAINGFVIREGRVRTGDAVELVGALSGDRAAGAAGLTGGHA
jgi:hypothetical protein